MPEETEIADTYVRNEAPWVDFSAGGAAPGGVNPVPPPTPDEDFTILVRPRRRGREVVAGAITAIIVLLAAWFTPGLISPATEGGRVMAYVVFAGGGIVALVVLVQAWRWARRRE